MKKLLVIIFLLFAVSSFALPPAPPASLTSLGGQSALSCTTNYPVLGTGQCGSGALGTAAYTASTAYQPAGTYLTTITDSTSTTSSTTAASATAVKSAYDLANGRQPALSLLAGTYTNGYLCTYTSSGTLLDCNTNPASFQAAGSYLTSANIASSISDSDTTHCPDGNSVFDALALKAPLASPTFTGTVGLPTVNFDGLTASTPLGLDGSKNVVSLTGMSFGDSYPVFYNVADPTKLMQFDLSGITASTTRTWTVPDVATPTFAYSSAIIDGSAAVTLTAAQMKAVNCEVTNYGQAAADVRITLPAAAFGYSCLFTVATAQSNHWGVLAGANDKIYLISSAGVATAGDDAAAAVMTAAQLGQAFACWSFNSGNATYDWMCKAISIGTSTFAAHAAF